MFHTTAPSPKRERTRIVPPLDITAYPRPIAPSSPATRSTSECPKADPGEVHLSYSQTRNYGGCPLAWWLSRRYAAEFVPANLIFGASFHAALDAYYQARLEGREAGLDDLLAAFSKHWSEELEGRHGHPPAPVKFSAKDESEENLLALAGRMLSAFLDRQHEQPSEVIAIEESFRIEIGDDLPPLVGRIDLIEIATGEDGQRTLCLTDFKTSSRKQTLDDIGNEQLLIYGRAAVGLGLVNAFNLPLALRYLLVTKTKEPQVLTVPAEHTPRDWTRLVEKIRMTWRGMQAGVVFPVTSWRCSGCGHARLCGEWPDLKDAPTRQAA